MSYYRKFESFFFDLLQKGTRNEWTTECGQAFNVIKSNLTEAPIFTYPQEKGSEFIMNTDASSHLIGGVLSQVQDGHKRVIAYASRTLHKTERNYCLTRRELLAVVYFTKYFRHYLFGRPLVLRTDHGSLQWIYKFKKFSTDK